MVTGGLLSVHPNVHKENSSQPMKWNILTCCYSKNIFHPDIVQNISVKCL